MRWQPLVTLPPDPDELLARIGDDYAATVTLTPESARDLAGVYELHVRGRSE